jgi:hypothetical protein
MKAPEAAEKRFKVTRSLLSQVRARRADISTTSSQSATPVKRCSLSNRSPPCPHILDRGTFRYNGDIDPAHVKIFGLIAEEVAKVSPDLAVRNANGEVIAIRFDSINAMLLNEFLKETARSKS